MSPAPGPGPAPKYCSECGARIYYGLLCSNACADRSRRRSSSSPSPFDPWTGVAVARQGEAEAEAEAVAPSWETEEAERWLANSADLYVVATALPPTAEVFEAVFGQALAARAGLDLAAVDWAYLAAGGWGLGWEGGDR